MTASTLFDPIRFGDIEAKNRVLMAPLTRGRAEEGHVPGELMVGYYRQRASAGLIVSEATAISPQGFGWSGAPGIWTPEQVAGWRKVTDAVHGADGRIVLQLWHMGALSHPDYQPGGALPVSSSDVVPKGKTRSADGEKEYVAPRPLEVSELPGIVSDFAEAAKRAIDAGFDGVEIHGANGYLLDQFLRDGPNRRTDDYGGSIDNRARLTVEVVEAVVNTVGNRRTGIRLSPYSPNGGTTDSDPVATFTRAAELIAPYDLAYLHFLEAVEGAMKVPGERVTPHVRRVYPGPIIANGGYDKTRAEALLASGEADAVAFGVKFIANPDLPARLAQNAELNRPDVKTFYTPGPAGYTDYPAMTA